MGADAVVVVVGLVVRRGGGLALVGYGSQAGLAVLVELAARVLGLVGADGGADAIGDAGEIESERGGSASCSSSAR